MFSKDNLKRLLIPLIIEQVLAVTIGIADTIMVSSVGEAAVSGISLVDSINILLINIFSALATGGAVIAAQYLGKGDHKQANFASKQLILVTGFISLVVAILCLIFRNQIITMVFGHIEPDVMVNCQIYLFLSALSYPFLALYNSGAALFRSMGNSKISMYCSICMNLINVMGNAILIYVFKLGVTGAALATLFSRICGCIFMLWMLKDSHNVIYIDSYFKLGFDFSKIKTILSIGVPNGMENGMFQVGKIIVQSLIATFGTSGIAANAVAGNLTMIVIIPASAIGLGMITVVGQCVGAKRHDEAIKYTKSLMKIAMISTFVLDVIIALLTPYLVSIYALSSETALLAEQIVIGYCIASALMWPLAFTLPNSLRAAGDAKYTMTISIISMWTCRIALSYFFANEMQMGVNGVWIAMYCDWIVRLIFFIGRFIQGGWKKHVLV